jgi:hypothetical protein
VLLAAVEVGGVPEVAPLLGVSETTVKTHLQHVFEKTGAKRQADLVKLVAGFMSPLGDNARCQIGARTKPNGSRTSSATSTMRRSIPRGGHSSSKM